MNTITARQRTAFFRLFAKACDKQGIAHTERESYRHSLINEATSKGSLTAVNSGGDYDDLMYLTARAAEEWETAAHFSTGRAKRLGTMISTVIKQIGQIKAVAGRGSSAGPLTVDDVASYVYGILKQMGRAPINFTSVSPTTWCLDVAEEDLNKVFMALDTHRRRTLRHYNYKGCLAFDLNLGYGWVGGTLTAMGHIDHSYYPVVVRVGGSAA